MKWVIYSGLLLLSFCLFFFLSPLKRVNAAVPSDDNPFILLTQSNNGYIITASAINPPSTYGQNIIVAQFLYTSGDYITYFSTIADAISALNNESYRWRAIGNSPYSSGIIIKGDSPFSDNDLFITYDDYLESLDPSWWDNVKQAFMDFVGSEALSDVLSGDWLSYIDDVLFGELWTVKVGEGEEDMIVPETVSATPTPSPTPIPTPIPYSTVINPDSGEITYHYTIDVSGTPVPTSSIYPPVTSTPPGPGSGSTIDEPVAVEDYYEPKDSLSVPKLRIFKFLLRMTGNDVDVGMDSLDDNMAVMDATLEDNAEAISSVGDLFQLIPIKWFILIGTLACFPVIAAMIKSLLGG